jgi:2-haloacid dehalogenase
VTTSNHGAHYQPFWALTESRCATPSSWSNRRRGKTGPTYEARAQQLMNQYRHLSAFPENREVLQALRHAAWPPAF